MPIIRVLSENNLNFIAHEMDNGVSFEELDDMLAEDIKAGTTRYFVKANDLWKFVPERPLENLLYSLLEFADA